MLPGTVLLVVDFPILRPLLESTALKMFIGPRVSFEELLAEKLILAFVLGIFITFSDELIYRMYMGSAPPLSILSEHLRNRLQHKVTCLYRLAEAPETSDVRRKQLWQWLGLFPIVQGQQPAATRSTVLGNVMDEYALYPLRVYGMDSRFFWQRIWLTLDKDVRKEIDTALAMAEGLLYSSFAFYLSSLAHVFALIVRLAVQRLNPGSVLFTKFLSKLPDWKLSLVYAVVALVLGWLLYLAAIPAFKWYGNYFKSQFDLYRDRVAVLQRIDPEEGRRWRDAWAYLRYNIASSGQPGGKPSLISLLATLLTRIHRQRR